LIKQGFSDGEEKDLAERCRLALEKSFGMAVPTPKSLAKKHK
jgi:hypothetical protein